MAQYLCLWVRAYWFSVTSFSKWLLGSHIRFFDFWTAWFWQCNSSLLWNFSFKFHVHVLCGSRQKPNDCQLCRFQNGCLVILNNVQLQSTHCPLPPSPMGRGYHSTVDHWSTISSLLRGDAAVIQLVISNFQTVSRIDALNISDEIASIWIP